MFRLFNLQKKAEKNKATAIVLGYCTPARIIDDIPLLDNYDAYSRALLDGLVNVVRTPSGKYAVALTDKGTAWAFKHKKSFNGLEKQVSDE